MNYNTTDRDNFAGQFGFLAESGTATNYTQGHKIDSIAGTAAAVSGLSATDCFYSYEYPLPSSLLGKYAKGLFPCSAVNKLDIQLYTNSQVPVSVQIDVSGSITTAPTVQFTIDNISLNLFMLTLDDVSARMLGSPKMHYLHGITQRTASSTIASGTGGYLTTLIGLRGKSCRQLLTRFCDTGSTGTANQVNGVFDSKMPLASQLNYLIAGAQRYPQFPHNTQILPSSVLSRTLMASEKFKEWEQRSSFIPSQFFKYITNGGSITAANGYDQNVVNAGSAASISNLSTFIFGDDLRKVHNSQILDGVDLTQTANHFLETNLIVGPSNTQTVFFTGRFDIIFEIDMEAGTINYRM